MDTSVDEFGGCFLEKTKVEAPVSTNEMGLNEAQILVKQFAAEEPPIEGFRYVFVDELQSDPNLKTKVIDEISPWAIIRLVNGFVEGKGYGGNVMRDKGDKTGVGEILMIS